MQNGPQPGIAPNPTVARAPAAYDRGDLSRTRLLLWAFISAVAAAIDYLIAELLMQHDNTWTAVGMIGITAVLTPVFYAINVRNARR